MKNYIKILDNRLGDTFEVTPDGHGRWYVINELTGKCIGVQTKAEAKLVFENHTQFDI